MVKYASGKYAHGCCERCGLRYDYKAFKEDGDTSGLMVCPECWDPKHPQDDPAPYLKKLPDAEALRHPLPCLHDEHCVRYFIYDDYPPTPMGFLGEYILDKDGNKVVQEVGDCG